MKRLFFTLSFLLGLTSYYAQEKNQKDASGKKQGEWVVLYEKSTVAQYKGQFKDDKPYGTFTYYYPSNKLKANMTFSKDGKTAYAEFFHEGGVLMSKGKFVNKIKDSIWTEYTSKGELSTQENYKMGNLDGVKYIYYPKKDGKPQIAQQYTYINGKLEGPAKEFFPDGVLKMDGNYKNEHLEGEVKYYNPGGSIARIEHYKNNLKHGWWIGYSDVGKEVGRRYFWKGTELKGNDLDAKMQELKISGKSPND